MKFVVVTGMSGSGKSKAMEYLEDFGYYCIDNVPPAMLTEFLRLFSSNDSVSDTIALGIDIRGGELYSDLNEAYVKLKKLSIDCKIMFLDASDHVLQSRYKETRRKHPLLDSCNGMLGDAIATERKLITPVRHISEYFIDTSSLSPSELKNQINKLFLDEPSKGISIMCVSYGTKYGSFGSADLNFDVRCLPNPFYVEELKNKTGLDKDVYDFVFENLTAKALKSKLFDLVDYLIPLYINEGKTQLVIGFCCTGGKHRSVAFAKCMQEHLARHGYDVSANHRDIKKN